MPSSWHDAVVQTLRDDPSLALRMARELAGADVPAGLPARVESPEFNDRPSTDFRPDALVCAGPAGEPSHVVIVEAQQQARPDKPAQWARYAAQAWLLLRCPVHVLVICRHPAVARFYDRPVQTSLPGFTLGLAVIGPAQVPAITDPRQAIASPGLAVLSVAVHGDQPAVAQAFAAALASLPPEQGTAYYENAYRMSPRPTRITLEEIMATSTWPVYSPFAKEHFGRGLAEGEARGVAEGQADAIMLVLQARGLPVTAGQKGRITGCTDLDQLRHWITRAAVIDSADELFA